MSLYERYAPYGIEVTLWLEMRKEGFTFDDLDPSKNDPAEDDIKKAKKWDIQWTMRSSGITVEDMKEFATYVNPNPVARPPPPLAAARDDDAKQQMDDGVANTPLASTGAADDKQQMDDGFPNKRHCHDPTGGAAAADKEQIDDDGVPNKPDGLPQEG